MLCHSLPLWRESRNLQNFIEPSFAIGASHSIFLSHCSLFSFAFRRMCARLQARGLAHGTAISAFTQLTVVVCSFLFCLKECVERITLLNLIYTQCQWFKRGNSHFQKLWTHLDKREKHTLRVTKHFRLVNGKTSFRCCQCKSQ